MIRNQFSYWLDITGEDIPKAIRMLEQDGTLVCSVEQDNSASFCVDEDLGTIEEWTDMETVLLSVSTGCPKAVLSMLAIDEDTKEEWRLVLAGGSCVKDVRSRVIGADDGYDAVTMEDIAKFLEEEGMTDAACAVRNEYPKRKETI